MHAADSLVLRRRLADVCRALVARGLSGPLASGNASLIDRERGLLVVTAKAVSFAALTYGDAVTVRLDERLEPRSFEATLRQPSTELPLHLAAYQAQDAACCLHTHSPWVVAAACLEIDELPLVHYHQGLLGERPTPVVPYATPGSTRLAELVGVAFRESPTVNAVLLANHGALVLGRSTKDALDRAEALEDVCRLVVLTAGQSRRLDPDELTALRELFANYRP